MQWMPRKQRCYHRAWPERACHASQQQKKKERVRDVEKHIDGVMCTRI